MILKNKSVIRAFILTIFMSACVSFVSGCAFIPVKTAGAYFKDLYRRIPYHRDGDYRVMNIYYATTREAEKRSDPSIYFTNKLADSMTFGRMDVRIDSRIRIGKMLPNRLRRRGIVGIQNVEKKDKETLIKELTEAVQASPHKSLLVLVFGYQDNFESTAIKAGYFSYLLDVNTPVLLFDWPGDQIFTPAGYKKAFSMANGSGPGLGELLTMVIREVKPEKLWVKASSLVCQVTCDAFEYMYKNEDLADKETEITHLIMAAPDVGVNEFDKEFKKEVSALASKVTVYLSSNDTALLISGIINKEKRLGRLSIKHEQLEEAKEMLYLKSLEPHRVDLIDVTPINNASYKHGYYLEAPEFYDDFYLRIFGAESKVNRKLYLFKCENNMDYWVMESGK